MATTCVSEPSLDDLATLDEAALLERIVLVYRQRFLKDPNPAKESWWDFVETLHETLDVDGRTSRVGLEFMIRDWTDEASRIARLLNRVFHNASLVWNDAAHPECRAPTAVMDVSSIASITDPELVEILRVMSSSCPACRTFSNAMDPARLQKGVETLLWQERLEEAQDEREYEYD